MPEDMKFRNVKWTFTFQVDGAKFVAHASDGPFLVRKVEVVTFEDRSSILVSGSRLSGRVSEGRSARFNINGYDKSPPPPEWLMKIVDMAGGPARQV